MAVVTNHNHFDRDEYTTLRRLGAKEGILVLPGVELGIKDGTISRLIGEEAEKVGR